jgi:hypothetical protein
MLYKPASGTGLPDGLFLYPKSQFGYILEGLGIKNVIIYYNNLEYFTVIWYILWQYGVVCGNLVYFPALVCLDQEKSGNPAQGAVRSSQSLNLS